MTLTILLSIAMQQSVDKEFSQVPIIDVSALVSGTGDKYTVATQIGQACRECGFFYIIVLTILKQDNAGGLQVRSKSGWVDAPPIPGSFVCNIGDMLDRMTRGLYRSTPHRVLNLSGRDHLSFPFFFDPNFNVEVKPIELKGVMVSDDQNERWDRASVHAFRGTYGDYLLGKVSKVFPELRQTVL
ncbi:2OG-Fe(II) oxygenase family protein [Scytonema hofmannii]|uniref:2OG-Fe(II) oxygenase family protein n=1 Tax=Scytonema hofmannii TaxID=34078 RepID=UPI000348EE87|nr:2OG-Fe(II) oxygenase family protein [Scytonema hofmannii]